MGFPLLGTLLLVALTSCGDNAATCDDRWESYVDACQCCYAAQIFAARDSVDVIPRIDEVERYFSRWRRAVEAEPILRGRIPQTYRASPPSLIEITTTNTAVIDAWSHQRVLTTDDEVDRAIGELGSVTIGPRYAPDPPMGQPWNFEVRETVVYSENQLNDSLRPASAWLDDPATAARDDGSWSWLAGDVAQIDFTFGWGDCFVACSGFHALRAIVPAAGAATVFDAGGDPLPDYLHLDPRTKPLP